MWFRSSGTFGEHQEQATCVDVALEATIDRAARRILSWHRVLVASHRDPDGDALGASLGLTLALRAHGCSVAAVNADPPLGRPSADVHTPSPPVGLAAIPGADLIVPWDRIDCGALDGMILVDCGTLDRLHQNADIPRRLLAQSRDLLVIDHHAAPSQRSMGEPDGVHAGETIRVVDPTRASSAELVALVIEAAGLPIDRDVATALLTGIATDTKAFLRDTTDARALACASHLRALGGEMCVAEDILHRHSVGFLALAGDVLGRALVTNDGAGIVVAIPEGLRLAHRLCDGDVELLTTILSGTREAYVVVVLQDQDGEIRGSVRTRAPIDAVAIARRFGGGGHARRSGFRLPRTPLNDVLHEVSIVVHTVISTVDRLPPN